MLSIRIDTNTPAFHDGTHGRERPEGRTPDFGETEATKAQTGYEPGKACRDEVARILFDISHDIRAGKDASKFQTIYDIYGNDVGRYRLLEDLA